MTASFISFCFLSQPHCFARDTNLLISTSLHSKFNCHFFCIFLSSFTFTHVVGHFQMATTVLVLYAAKMSKTIQFQDFDRSILLKVRICILTVSIPINYATFPYILFTFILLNFLARYSLFLCCMLETI